MAEFNTGVLTPNAAPRLTSNFVGKTDPSDVFSFTMGNASKLNVALTNMSQDADLRVYRDVDNNGLLNTNIDTQIGSSTRGGKLDDSVNTRLGAGNYLAEVAQSSGNTNYQLRLSATDNISNLLPTEVNVGALNGTRTFNDFVGNSDTADVYGFRVAASGNFHLDLTGLAADADVRVIQDFNNNKSVGPGDVIVSASQNGTNPESIDVFLSAGVNYFAQVSQFSGDTSYTLNLSSFA